MKRKLSLLLALVMILSLVPMSAFAASTNKVDRVPKVSDDAVFKEGDANLPLLMIEEDNTVFSSVYGEEFYLELENADWTEFGTVDLVGDDYRIDGSDPAGKTSTISYESDTSAKVVLYGSDEKERDDDAFFIPMLVDVDDVGEVKVVVNRMDSRVDAGTYTIAIVGDGDTVATVDDSETLGHRETDQLARITIEETSINAVKGKQEFDIELTDDFHWVAEYGEGDDKVELEIKDFEGNDVKEYDKDTNKDTYFTIDDEVLTIVLDDVDENKRVRRRMTIVPLVNATKDADYGDIEVDIDVDKGEISEEDNLLIGEYSDYAYTVSTDEDYDDVIIAGKVDDDYLSAEVTIEEEIADSLWSGKEIEVELPDGVEIREDFTVESDRGSVPKIQEIGESSFEFEVPQDGSGKHEFTFEIPLVASVDFEGEVEITITGDAIGRGNEETIVVAEVVKPIEVEIETVDVVIGTQKQEAPNIIVKENIEGALKEDGVLVFDLDSVFGGMEFDDADIEVIDGDLEIDEDDSDVDGNLLKVKIDKESDEPSTIEISNVTVSLNRNVPVGPFDVAVKGNAIIDYMNGDDYIDVGTGDDAIKEAFDDLEDAITEVEFVNVVTKIDLEQDRSATFVIDSNEYVVDGEVMTTDAAPYIDAAAGRTMLPIRVFATALGVSDDSIVWNQGEQSVTIFKGDRVIKVVMGQQSYSVNGISVPMDAAAVNNNGRTFLPLRSLAQALGAEITWDEATRTVGVNQ